MAVLIRICVDSVAAVVDLFVDEWCICVEGLQDLGLEIFDVWEDEDDVEMSSRSALLWLRLRVLLR